MIQVVANAVKMRLIDAPRNAQLEIHQLLSYFVEGAEHSQAYRSGQWNGTQSFFDMKTQTCPAGFVPLVERQLSKLNLPFVTRRVKLPEPLGPELEIVQEKTGFPYHPRYDYQHNAVRKLLEVGQMIAMIATGGGKALTAALAYWRIARPTLFVTTRSALAYQMRDTLLSKGEKTVGFIGDNIWSPNLDGFNVAMSQTLASRIKPFDEKQEEKKLKHEIARDSQGKPKKDRQGNPVYVKTAAYSKALLEAVNNPQSLIIYNESVKLRLMQLKQEHLAKQQEIENLLSRFEFVILEEAHESSANGYYSVMNACKNAHYRLALTATPFVRASDEQNMRLMACSGPIGIKVSEKTLIERGVLATPYFKYIDIDKTPNLLRTTPWPQAYDIGIVNNEARNKIIIDEAVKAVSYNLPTLILVIRKKHGQDLLEQCKRRGIRAKFLFGESSAEERTDVLHQLRDGKLQVLIGSTIVDVGVDVPSLGLIILAGGGKAETALRQRIGRGLRAKKHGPNTAFIIDFIDHGNNTLYAHSRQRKKIVENIDGFKQNILQKNQEFPYK